MARPRPQRSKSGFFHCFFFGHVCLDHACFYGEASNQHFASADSRHVCPSCLRCNPSHERQSCQFSRCPSLPATFCSSIDRALSHAPLATGTRGCTLQREAAKMRDTALPVNEISHASDLHAPSTAGVSTSDATSTFREEAKRFTVERQNIGETQGSVQEALGRFWCVQHAIICSWRN